MFLVVYCLLQLLSSTSLFVIPCSLFIFHHPWISEERCFAETKDWRTQGSGIGRSSNGRGQKVNLPRSSGDEQHITFKSGDLNERLKYRILIFIIPGFRKNNVSQKRVIGEHRDRELAKRQWTRAKPGIYPARQETSNILHSSQET